VFGLPCQTANLWRIKILAQWCRSRHDEPPGFAMLNLTRLHLGIAHESQFQGLGIIRKNWVTFPINAKRLRTPPTSRRDIVVLQAKLGLVEAQDLFGLLLRSKAERNLTIS